MSKALHGTRVVTMPWKVWHLIYFTFDTHCHSYLFYFRSSHRLHPMFPLSVLGFMTGLAMKFKPLERMERSGRQVIDTANSKTQGTSSSTVSGQGCVFTGGWGASIFRVWQMGFRVCFAQGGQLALNSLHTLVCAWPSMSSTVEECWLQTFMLVCSCMFFSYSRTSSIVISERSQDVGNFRY